MTRWKSHSGMSAVLNPGHQLGSLSTLICIHGFLGRAQDWDSVMPRHYSRVGVDLFSTDQENGTQWDLRSLGSEVNIVGGLQRAPRVVVGYSLGGRIALEALLDQPQNWAGAVIISAHPGLSDPEERKKRMLSDEVWAERFVREDWQGLLVHWNAQSVFQGSEVPLRSELDFSRTALAGVLRGCSLGRQRDLRAELKGLDLPILWVVGEKDQKFLKLAQEVAGINSRIELAVLSGASHRVPWDRSELFSERLVQFLSSIS